MPCRASGTRTWAGCSIPRARRPSGGSRRSSWKTRSCGASTTPSFRSSVCHFFGRRRFEVDDHSTNVFWLAIPSLGESWHHNHHAFPRAAQQGLRWWEIDISAAIITLMEKLGLAWNVIRISPERQEQRLAGSGKGAAPRRLAVEAD